MMPVQDFRSRYPWLLHKDVLMSRESRKPGATLAAYSPSMDIAVPPSLAPYGIQSIHGHKKGDPKVPFENVAYWMLLNKACYTALEL